MADTYVPEVGQALFGNAYAAWECPKYVEAFVNHILREIERVYWNREQKRWEQEDDPRIPGIVFNPYWWGDCSCGYEERWAPKDEAWCAEHRHAPNCYQSDLAAAMDAWDREHGYADLEAASFGENGPSMLGAFDGEARGEAPGVFTWVGVPRRDPAMEAWRKSQDARTKYARRVYRRLAKKHGVDPHHGAAVHCTCDYARLRAEWLETDAHAPTCGVVRPNLAFGGAEVSWYKRPGRGQTVNVEWDEARWRQWLDEGMRLLREEDARTMANRGIV